MTVKDMAQILSVLRANLPSAFLQLTAEDATFMAQEWAAMFANEKPEIVLAAARTYCYRTTQNKAFPAPGNIREIVEEIKSTIDCIASGVPIWGFRRNPLPPEVAEKVTREGMRRYARKFGEPHPVYLVMAAELAEENARG